jgi:hypothetical protein
MEYVSLESSFLDCRILKLAPKFFISVTVYYQNLGQSISTAIPTIRFTITGGCAKLQIRALRAQQRGHDT